MLSSILCKIPFPFLPFHRKKHPRKKTAVGSLGFFLALTLLIGGESCLYSADWQSKTPSNTSVEVSHPTKSTPSKSQVEPIPAEIVDDSHTVPVASSQAYSGRSPISLPREGGQIWKEYDITPYTRRVTTTNRPEQAMTDWILRDTGYEVWHGSPLGILSVTPKTIRVYHTPQMQARIAAMVRRFTGTQAEMYAFGLRVISIGSPDWRTRSQKTLRPVITQSTGIQAWVLRREEAAVLLGDLRRRSDYREHGSPHLLIHNGQSNVVSLMRPKNFLQDVSIQNGAWTSGFQQQMGQIDEGFALEFSPLLSEDTKTIDAAIKCSMTNVEKLHSVEIELPQTGGPQPRTKIEVPQLTQFQFNERFRWPTDQVLLIAMSMVPAPIASGGATTVTEFFTGKRDRVEMLVMIESRPQTPTAAAATTAQPIRQAQREARSYHGRY